MNPARRTQIERMAAIVRTNTDITAMPVDPAEVVKKLNGRVKDKWALAKGVEALVQRIADGSDCEFEIQISVTVHDNRRKFSIAHELGHLFLHMGYKTNPTKWATVEPYLDGAMFRQGHTEEEYEANEFAGALLMPKDLFAEQVKANENPETHRIRVQPIADFFGVSVDAVKTRGALLRLLAWK